MKPGVKRQRNSGKNSKIESPERGDGIEPGVKRERNSGSGDRRAEPPRGDGTSYGERDSTFPTPLPGFGQWETDYPELRSGLYSVVASGTLQSEAPKVRRN